MLAEARLKLPHSGGEFQHLVLEGPIGAETASQPEAPNLSLSPKRGIESSSNQAILRPWGLGHTQQETPGLLQSLPKAAESPILGWPLGQTYLQARLEKLGVTVEAHGKMPDVVLFDQVRNWLLLVEAVTSHGPVDGKRHGELAQLFAGATAGLVYVTAFPDRATMARYVSEISWETEVWVGDAPSHLIHFNGPRYLGPYTTSGA